MLISSFANVEKFIWYFWQVPQKIHNVLLKWANQTQFYWKDWIWMAHFILIDIFQQEVVNFLKNLSKILRNYQMNSSTLANELINIFRNASVSTAVKLICVSSTYAFEMAFAEQRISLKVGKIHVIFLTDMLLCCTVCWFERYFSFCKI